MYTTIITAIVLLLIPTSSLQQQPVETEPQNLMNCLIWQWNLGIEYGDLHRRFSDVVATDPNGTSKAADDLTKDYEEQHKETDRFNIECVFSGLNIPRFPESVQSSLARCDDKGIQCIKEEIKTDCQTYPELANIDCEGISRCLDLPTAEGGKEVIECIKGYHSADSNCAESYYNLAVRLVFLHNRFYEMTFVDRTVEPAEKDNYVKVFKENSAEVDRFNIECKKAGFNLPKF